MPSECQTVWIKIRPDVLLGLIWVQTVCKGYKQRQKSSPARKELRCLNTQGKYDTLISTVKTDTKYTSSIKTKGKGKKSTPKSHGLILLSVAHTFKTFDIRHVFSYQKVLTFSLFLQENKCCLTEVLLS